MTRRLLEYWSDPSREKKLFFCQREAVETVVYLAEVAARYGDAWIENYLRDGNGEYNAEPATAREAWRHAARQTGKPIRPPR